MVVVRAKFVSMMKTPFIVSILRTVSNFSLTEVKLRRIKQSRDVDQNANSPNLRDLNF